MQVAKPKKGYKLVKTSFGKYEEIPEEWSIEKFKDFVSLKHGFAFSSNDFIDSDGIKIVKIGDIRQDCSVRVEDLVQVSIEIGEKNDEFSVVNGDVLMALTGATLGKTGIVSTDEKLLQNQRVGNIFPTDSRMLDKKFLFFILTSDFIQNQVWSFVSSSAQPNIGKSELDKINFFKPRNISEQKQIASILSNVDDTLQKTNQIIDQTQRLKTGMMQKLLTRGIGHTKFKKIKCLFGKYIEIPEEWEHKELDTISKIVGGGTPDTTKNEYWDGDIPWAVPTDITNLDRNYIENTQRKITKEGLDKSSSKLLPKNSILLTTRATIGYCAICTKPMATNQGFQNVICNSNADNLFILYALRFNKNLLTSLANGTTFAEISKRNVSSVKIAIPPLPEQKQIASILSNVDTQIQKEKLHKSNLERLKKGLMQKLLTGQIRVKV